MVDQYAAKVTRDAFIENHAMLIAQKNKGTKSVKLGGCPNSADIPLTLISRKTN